MSERMFGDDIRTVIRAEMDKAKDDKASDQEFALFVATCERTQLDPLARQLYPIWRKSYGKKIMGIQVSIDGFRLIAERTGVYEGQDGPYWCGMDGVWCDVWLEPEPPVAAKVSVFRRGFVMPLTAVASWRSYAQYKRDGSLTQMWDRFGSLMLGKCSESQALRRAFPQELSGLYTADEMGQAMVADVTPRAQVAKHGIDGEIVESAKEQRRNAPPANTTRRRLPAEQMRSDHYTTQEPVNDPEGANAAIIIAKIHALGEGRSGDASDSQKQTAARLVRALFVGKDDDTGRAMRRQLVAAVYGIEGEESWKKLSHAQAHSLIEWAIVGGKDDDGKTNYDPSPQAITEAAVILAAYGESQGQQKLDMGDLSLGDKISGLIGRCSEAYFGTAWDVDTVCGCAADLFPDGYEKLEAGDIPIAIVQQFDMLLAEEEAERYGVNLVPVKLIGTLTEKAGPAGGATQPIDLKARAVAVRDYVQTLTDGDSGVEDIDI